VRFEIAADGSCSVSLRTSTGNSQLDADTIETLRQWRWRPALRDGEPVPSVQNLRVEFVVE
jgi:protein TonB